MRDILFFIASLAGAAVFTALAILVHPESPLWKWILWIGLGVFISCTLVFLVDFIWPGRSAWFLAGMGIGAGLLVVFGIAFFVETPAPLEKRVDDLAGLLEIVQRSQALDANEQMAAAARQALLTAWDKLREAMTLREQSIGREDFAERSATAEHILNELKAIAQSTKVLALKGGQGLIIATAPNTFRITFPVPMARTPNVGFISVPSGSKCPNLNRVGCIMGRTVS
jgi:hypothetical protein